MIIKELYEWAIQNGAVNYNIEIQYRDGGGYCSGTDCLFKSDIEIVNKDEIVIL